MRKVEIATRIKKILFKAKPFIDKVFAYSSPNIFEYFHSFSTIYLVIKTKGLPLHSQRRKRNAGKSSLSDIRY